MFVLLMMLYVGPIMIRQYNVFYSILFNMTSYIVIREDIFYEKYEEEN